MMCIHARAQQFVNVAGSQNLAHSYSGGLYGSGPSFHDFNRDGWDDLTLPDYSSENMFYINTNGEYTPYRAARLCQNI